MDPILRFGVFLAIGGLILRQVRKFGPTVALCRKMPGLREFVECDLCIGSWLFMGLAPIMDVVVRVSPLENWLGDLANIGVTGMVSAFSLMIVKSGLAQYVLWHDHDWGPDSSPELEAESEAPQDAEQNN